MGSSWGVSRTSQGEPGASSLDSVRGALCVHSITVLKGPYQKNTVLQGVLFLHESIDGSNEWHYGSDSSSSLQEVVKLNQAQSDWRLVGTHGILSSCPTVIRSAYQSPVDAKRQKAKWVKRPTFGILHPRLPVEREPLIAWACGPFSSPILISGFMLQPGFFQKDGSRRPARLILPSPNIFH